jgi:hypothetical protein
MDSTQVKSFYNRVVILGFDSAIKEVISTTVITSNIAKASWF